MPTTRPAPPRPAAPVATRPVQRPVLLLVLPVLPLVVLLGGCRADDDPPPGDPGPPARATECDHRPRAHGDGGVTTGLDWPSGEHPFGRTVVLWGCASGSSPGLTMQVTEVPDGVHVTPLSGVPSPSTRLVRYEVRVDPGTEGGRFLVTEADRSFSSTLPGPTVVVGSQGWRFEAPER